MLTVDEAIAAIVQSVDPLPAVTVELGDALGLILAEDIVSDADSPPFDKSLMDGYAVRATDAIKGATLRIIEEVTAGRVAQREVGPGEATRIMTGARIPVGADAVIPVEQTDSDAVAGHVRIDTDRLTSGANILPQGVSLRRGEQVMAAGRRLRAQELGALAELGRHRVAVRQRPRVAVLATGDELVPVSAKPGPGQIRNSNETMLVAQLRQAGAEPVPLGIARDDRSDLRAKIAAGLECDMLLLSGGVSEGKLDLVPSELEAAGVLPIFHKIRLKPGKPLWFGLLAGSAKPVFGLPGNPVSSMVGFELFARTALRRLMGHEPAAPKLLQARLAQEHLARGDRPTYHPASLASEGGTWTVRPVAWQGSADLRATVDANALALFPAGDRVWPEGAVVDVLPL